MKLGKINVLQELHRASLYRARFEGKDLFFSMEFRGKIPRIKIISFGKITHDEMARWMIAKLSDVISDVPEIKEIREENNEKQEDLQY